MRLRWTRASLQHLKEIADYISQDNPTAARRVVQFIRQQVAMLPRQPGIGRPGRVEGTRELVISRFPYIVAYRANDSDVEVLAVIHTSRRWPTRIPQ